MNIIEAVQKNLGFESLKKIDPNTQETSGTTQSIGNSSIAQAGIPAILLGIYNHLEEEPNLDLLKSESGDWLGKIFGKSADIVVRQIDQYSKLKDTHSTQQLNHIASESIRVINENLAGKTDETSIRNFVAKNKPDTLLYLPPSLQLGKILKNENLDDRTGKMEGPISSLMRSVEKTFNSSSSQN